MFIFITTKEEDMLKYWSNSFMTTGAAIIATGVFTDKPIHGVIAGCFLVLIGSLFCWISLNENGGKQ